MTFEGTTTTPPNTADTESYLGAAGLRLPRFFFISAKTYFADRGSPLKFKLGRPFHLRVTYDFVGD